MKRFVVILAVILSVSSFYFIFKENPTDDGYVSPDKYEGYKLVWDDDFNEKDINKERWTFIKGNGCPELCGFGNNELQNYTDDKDNAFIKDGNLLIKAIKDGALYTSSKVKTSAHSWKFGRVDVRAKLPKGKGIWPAIWMMPAENKLGGWPKSGELDIMEVVGHLPNELNGTIHFGDYWPQNKKKNHTYTLPAGDFSEKYHVFSILWEKDLIVWLVDDVEYAKVTPADVDPFTYPFNEKFYLIINLAVGGNWPGNPDKTTVFPQEMAIDYVRVFQKNDN